MELEFDLEKKDEGTVEAAEEAANTEEGQPAAEEAPAAAEEAPAAEKAEAVAEADAPEKEELRLKSEFHLQRFHIFPIRLQNILYLRFFFQTALIDLNEHRSFLQLLLPQKCPYLIYEQCLVLNCHLDLIVS